ncbi:universal stress protein [Noviherbaspirillum sp. 1P10PC]|uniref:universal stress protein n=1 Tax=Noviherbaspirillum sp. 1P10PC TaxID=3132292 RepID=UPI0039A376C0
MLKILVPVDGSDNALRAVAYVISLASNNASLHCELLHVSQPFGVREHAWRSHAELATISGEEAQRALAPARTALQAAAVPCSEQVAQGEAAPQIVAHAVHAGCDGIVMGMRGVGLVIGPVSLGSVSSRVVHASGLPVTLVK